MRLMLAAAGLHLQWLRQRSLRLLAVPAGVVFAVMADRSGQPAAQVAAALGPLSAFCVALGYNDSRLRAYMISTTFGRPGAYRILALEAWLAPLIAALALSESAALLMGAGGAAPCWQTYVTLAFISLAAASAAAFTRGITQKLAAGLVGTMLVLQLLLRPGASSIAELLLPTAWPALSMAGGASFHADIYMGLSMLLGVGVSLVLGRGGLARPGPAQLSDPPSQGG